MTSYLWTTSLSWSTFNLSTIHDPIFCLLRKCSWQGWPQRLYIYPLTILFGLKLVVIIPHRLCRFSRWTQVRGLQVKPHSSFISLTLFLSPVATHLIFRTATTLFPFGVFPGSGEPLLSQVTVQVLATTPCGGEAGLLMYCVFPLKSRSVCVLLFVIRGGFRYAGGMRLLFVLTANKKSTVNLRPRGTHLGWRRILTLTPHSPCSNYSLSVISWPRFLDCSIPSTPESRFLFIFISTWVDIRAAQNGVYPRKVSGFKFRARLIWRYNGGLFAWKSYGVFPSFVMWSSVVWWLLQTRLSLQYLYGVL